MPDSNPWERDKREASPGIDPALVLSKGGVRRNAFDIDFRRLLYLWPYVIASVVLAGILAKVYLRYSVPVYESKLSVSMQGNDQGIPLGTTSLFDTRNPMQDKADLLAAPTTLKLVVDSLRLEYAAIAKGRIKDMDLYRKLSWRIINKRQPQPFSLTLLPDEKGGFEWTKDKKKGYAKWGQLFTVGADSLLVYTNMDFGEDDEIELVLRDPWDVVFDLADKVKVTIGEQSNSATITIQDRLPVRANDILTAIVEAYNYSSIDYKSKSLVQSINFMNQRIAPLSGELDSIETAIANYKSSKGVVGISAPGELYLSKTSELDAAANNITLQRQVLDAVEQYVNSPDLKEENLSLVGLSDAYMNSLVGQYQQLLADRKKLALVVTPQNPKMVLVDNQIAQTRQNINEQLRNYRNNIALQQNNINRQLGQAQSLLRSTPAVEKVLLEKQRQQEIKQSLFLLLLEKREEANISLASTTSDVRLLSPARTGAPVKPKPLVVYGVALIGGLLLPLLVGVGREVLNTSITSKDQLEQMLSAPVLGSIDESEEQGEKFALVAHDDRSVSAEQIRGIRATLRFYGKPDKPLVVLATSSFSGEGKTFLSGNLARGYALQQKRVALLEFDMRKPKLAKRMGLKTRTGISSVLTGHAKPDEVFVPDTETPNLHLYPTGAIPPNPSELITTPAMETFRQYLLAHYDVIIIDTPPLGLVSDAQLLSEWADVSIVVIRFNVTPRSQVREIENWNVLGKLKNMAIVLNGVKTSGYYGYNYSPYYYRRKYGSEYYAPRGNKGRKRSKSSVGQSDK